MLLGLLLTLANHLTKFYYPTHCAIMAIKHQKKEAVVAILKYFILLFVMMCFEYLISLITSSEVVSFMTLGIYYLLVKSDFDYSVLVFNLLCPREQPKVEKFGKVMQKYQNLLNDFLNNNVGEKLQSLK